MTIFIVSNGNDHVVVEDGRGVLAASDLGIAQDYLYDRQHGVNHEDAAEKQLSRHGVKTPSTEENR